MYYTRVGALGPPPPATAVPSVCPPLPWLKIAQIVCHLVLLDLVLNAQIHADKQMHTSLKNESHAFYFDVYTNVLTQLSYFTLMNVHIG